MSGKWKTLYTFPKGLVFPNQINKIFLRIIVITVYIYSPLGVEDVRRKRCLPSVKDFTSEEPSGTIEGTHALFLQPISAYKIKKKLQLSMKSVFYLHIMRAIKILGLLQLSQLASGVPNSAGYCYKTTWRIRRIRVLCDCLFSMNVTLTITPECSLLYIELYSYWNEDEINAPYTRFSLQVWTQYFKWHRNFPAGNDCSKWLWCDETVISFIYYAVWGLCLINRVIESVHIRLLSVFITATLENL